MAFKRRRGGSRDPFEHLQEEREKLEGEEQPWFLADDDDAEVLQVEAGISSLISDTDLGGDAAEPAAGGPLPSDSPPEPVVEPAPVDSTMGVEEGPPVGPTMGVEEATPVGPTALLDEVERDRTEIDTTAEPDRKAVSAAPTYADQPVLEAPEPAPELEPPLSLPNAASAPIFDLPDHIDEPLVSAEPIRLPSFDQASAVSDSFPAGDAPAVVDEFEATPGPDEFPEYLRPQSSEPQLSDTSTHLPVAETPPSVEEAPPPPPSEPEGADSRPLESKLVQSFRDLVAQAPPAPPLDESEWPPGVDLQPEQPAHGASPQRVEPRKPRRPPRRPSGF
jgi:hypothetical protein